MATDYAEKERQFVDTLSQDSGKDLHGWMMAISAEKLSNRNDIIDWLRHQGFQFAKASWLERIHHNGGRLIYAQDVSPALAQRAPADLREAETQASDSTIVTSVAGTKNAEAFTKQMTRPPESNTVATAIIPFKAAAAPSFSPSAEVIAGLAQAKGLRPLAELIVREIVRAVPDVVIHARSPLIMATAPHPFLALWPSPKLLRLYGNFGSPTAGAIVRPAEAVMKAPAPFPHMMALDDARLIDADFRALLENALERAAAP